MSITRRVFMRNGALAVIGTAAIPAFLSRAVYAADSLTGGKKRMVVIFQRGAADGLNIVVPHAESSYYSMRPTIAIPRQNVIDLDGFFGLHPSMAAFQPLWKDGHLAIIHAAGSPDTTRSHFDAQDYMESGTPGMKSTEDGWLNRALHVTMRNADKQKAIAIPCRRHGRTTATHSRRNRARRCHGQHQQLRRWRTESWCCADRKHLRIYVCAVG